MRYLSEVEIKNKRVILRCDFNVPVVDDNICDDSKIKKSLDTINYLLENNNTIILLSHFGRIKKEEDKEKNSLRIVYEYLKKIIDIDFINNPLDLGIINSSEKKCFLVENTRFTDIPVKRESSNDLELAKYWASFGDIFIVDAFASLHRAHSSTAGIAKYLPTYLGFLVEKEIKNLEPLVKTTEKPFLVIMGGAKVDDKIKIIESMLKTCDKLIITGGILNTYLKLQGYNIGNSLVTTDEEVLENVKQVFMNNKEKISFSDKFIIKRDNENIEVSINEVRDGDIIYDNIPDLLDIMNNAKTIFFNGTCGRYEDSNYEIGTKKLLNDLKNSNAKVYIGGGDTTSAVNKLGFANSYTYVSSGGGATLEFVAYKSLKALDYIKNIIVDN